MTDDRNRSKRKTENMRTKHREDLMRVEPMRVKKVLCLRDEQGKKWTREKERRQVE